MKELTCIVCPKGCRLHIDEQQDFAVTGNSCPRGAQYGRKEMTAPTRTVTSTVRVSGGDIRRAPVKTSQDIPKQYVFDAMRLLDGVEISPPLPSGSVVVRDICGTGADWITTKAI